MGAPDEKDRLAYVGQLVFQAAAVIVLDQFLQRLSGYQVVEIIKRL